MKNLFTLRNIVAASMVCILLVVTVGIITLNAGSDDTPGSYNPYDPQDTYDIPPQPTTEPYYPADPPYPEYPADEPPVIDELIFKDTMEEMREANPDFPWHLVDSPENYFFRHDIAPIFEGVSGFFWAYADPHDLYWEQFREFEAERAWRGEQMEIVSFIQFFDIDRETFDRINAEVNVSLDQDAASMGLTVPPIHRLNADIIFTFDNDLIREYYSNRRYIHYWHIQNNQGNDDHQGNQNQGNNGNEDDQCGGSGRPGGGNQGGNDNEQ